MKQILLPILVVLFWRGAWEFHDALDCDGATSAGFCLEGDDHMRSGVISLVIGVVLVAAFNVGQCLRARAIDAPFVEGTMYGEMVRMLAEVQEDEVVTAVRAMRERELRKLGLGAVLVRMTPGIVAAGAGPRVTAAARTVADDDADETSDLEKADGLPPSGLVGDGLKAATRRARRASSQVSTVGWDAAAERTRAKYRGPQWSLSSSSSAIATLSSSSSSDADAGRRRDFGRPAVGITKLTSPAQPVFDPPSASSSWSSSWASSEAPRPPPLDQGVVDRVPVPATGDDLLPPPVDREDATGRTLADKLRGAAGVANQRMHDLDDGLWGAAKDGSAGGAVDPFEGLGVKPVDDGSGRSGRRHHGTAPMPAFDVVDLWLGSGTTTASSAQASAKCSSSSEQSRGSDDDDDDWSPVSLPVRLLKSAVIVALAIASVEFWRGVWYLSDELILPGAPLAVSALVSHLAAIPILVATRSMGGLVPAPVTSLFDFSFEGVSIVFAPGIIVAEGFFVRIVVGAAIVSYWRGAWLLLDVLCWDVLGMSVTASALPSLAIMLVVVGVVAVVELRDSTTLSGLFLGLNRWLRYLLLYLLGWVAVNAWRGWWYLAAACDASANLAVWTALQALVGAGVCWGLGAASNLRAAPYLDDVYLPLDTVFNGWRFSYDEAVASQADNPSRLEFTKNTFNATQARLMSTSRTQINLAYSAADLNALRQETSLRNLRSWVSTPTLREGDSGV